MTRVIPVAHPTLARYVPRGARKAVPAVVEVTTNVRLTEAEPAGFRNVRTLHHDTRIAEHDGRLWRTLPVGKGSATPDDLAAYLSGSEDTGRMGEAFAGTPLLAKRDGAGPWRGEPAAMLEGARQANVGIDVSGARVQAFVDDYVRIAGDEVYVRTDMLVCANWHARNVHEILNPFGMDALGLLGHPARQKPLWDHFLNGPGGNTSEIAKARRAFARSTRDIPFELVPDGAEVAPTLSHFVRQMGEAIKEKATNDGYRTGARAVLAAFHADNAALWFDGATGMVGADRLPEVLALHDAYNECLGTTWHARFPEGLHRTSAYVREAIAPMCAPPPPDAADIEALKDLTPGM